MNETITNKHNIGMAKIAKTISKRDNKSDSAKEQIVVSQICTRHNLRQRGPLEKSAPTEVKSDNEIYTVSNKATSNLKTSAKSNDDNLATSNKTLVNLKKSTERNEMRKINVSTKHHIGIAKSTKKAPKRGNNGISSKEEPVESRVKTRQNLQRKELLEKSIPAKIESDFKILNPIKTTSNLKNATTLNKTLVNLKTPAEKNPIRKNNNSKKRTIGITKSTTTTPKITVKTQQHSQHKGPLEKSITAKTENDNDISNKAILDSKTPSKRTPNGNKNRSIRLLEKRDSPKEIKEKIAIYDFTFDPSEEPDPQKKKKKKPNRKKVPPKPRTFVFKNNYNKNISNLLASLKTVVTKNKIDVSNKNVNINKGENVKAVNKEIIRKGDNTVQIKSTVVTRKKDKTVGMKENEKSNDCTAIKPLDINRNNQIFSQRNNVQVPRNSSDINYSPTPITTNPVISKSDVKLLAGSVDDNAATCDLQEGLSFFDDQPVASSSFNVSARHSLASPWRVEFENLPIKWGVNTYVKSNMTPAYECSFMNFPEKKHKYVTNMFPEALPEIVSSTPRNPNWKQTSIISFIKEVNEKNNVKKKYRSTITPTKSNSVFNDSNNCGVFENSLMHTTGLKSNSPKDIDNINNNKSPLKASSKDMDGIDSNRSPLNASSPRESDHINIKTSALKAGSACDIDNNNKPPGTELIMTPLRSNISNVNKDKTTLKRKLSNSPSKLEIKKKDPIIASQDNFFGFDDSINNDQENISPNKKIKPKTVRNLRSHSKRVLGDINQQTGPCRAKLPLIARTKFAPSSEIVNDIYEQLKAANGAPVFPEKDTAMDKAESIQINDTDPEWEQSKVDECPPAVLFEDMEIVHHSKPTRKSYGKAKKVTFHQPSLTTEQVTSDEEPEFSDMESTFKVPIIKVKKPNKKKTKAQIKSKKEEAEAEAWAAGFNSMCEDVDEFDLVFE